MENFIFFLFYIDYVEQQFQCATQRDALVLGHGARKNLSVIDLFKLFTERQKTLKKFGPTTWWTKKPFGYRVIHQNSLTSCPGQYVFIFMLM